MTARAGRSGPRIVVLLSLLLWGGIAWPQLAGHNGIAWNQSAGHKSKRVAPRAISTSLTFMWKDGSCVDGPISRIDPKAVVIQQNQGPPVTIQRDQLMQVSQSDSLVYSARSSWADVQAIHLLRRESLMLKLNNGKVINDNPVQVTADGMVFKRFLWLTKRVSKKEIVTVDYLRMKPDSAAFDYFTLEAPALLFFYPEFYDRLKGLEGRIPVRLYDSVRPEDDAQLKCSSR